MHIVQCVLGITPPPKYGGVERLGFWFAREMIRRGHRVSVMTDPRSTIGKLLPEVEVIPMPTLDPVDLLPIPRDWDYRDLIPTDADVVHFHAAPPPEALPEVPFIVTEHGIRRVTRNPDRFHGYSPNTVFVSRSHAENHGAELFVDNGVPLEDYPLETVKDDYMLFLAALSWRRKNAKTAIHLSFDSGMPLKLAGGEIPGNRALRGAWKLRLPSHRSLLEPVGRVGGQRKLDLLQKARLLFFVVGWEEPGPVAPNESLACGTPVLASACGALREYIKDGENGFIVHSYRQALARIDEIRRLSPDEMAEMAERCRASAYRVEDSVEGYLELYDRVIKDRWLYPPERARQIRARGLDVHKMRRGKRRIRRYPFKLG